jgi:uncharacterized HAD superfamily protein/hypoxanthine phosphoribosyltransferase
MEFRSLSDLSRTIVENLFRLPYDIDLVVGVPRSGLLAANIIALQMNIPVMDLESFLIGRDAQVGRTVAPTMKVSTHGNWKKVIIIDDSIASGESLKEVQAKVQSYDLSCEIIYGVIYGIRSFYDNVDIVFEVVENPRIFEWNMMRHSIIRDACFDIDGVLCHDPLLTDNDDGNKYMRFLLSARPLYKTHIPVRHLVTSRLEKYRAQTEEWLRQHGIEYEKLWMLDLPSAEERRRLNAHATFKAKIYNETKALIFVESEDDQASDIARISNLPVLSIEGLRIIWPNDTSSKKKYRRRSEKLSSRRKIHVATLAYLLGEARFSKLKKLIRNK